MISVIRTLKGFKSYLPKLSKRILPKVLMVDEFRSHASIEEKMSFICADSETGKLADILHTRKSPRLTSYFLGRTNLEEAKFLVTDMKVAYFQLTKRVLPNAKIVIDQLHIVKHMNQAFNELRKAVHNSQAEKLKKNWRFLLKIHANINHYEYKTWKSILAPKYPLLTETMMIDQLAFLRPEGRVSFFFMSLLQSFEKKPLTCFSLYWKNLKR